MLHGFSYLPVQNLTLFWIHFNLRGIKTFAHLLLNSATLLPHGLSQEDFWRVRTSMLQNISSDEPKALEHNLSLPSSRPASLSPSENLHSAYVVVAPHKGTAAADILLRWWPQIPKMTLVHTTPSIRTVQLHGFCVPLKITASLGMNYTDAEPSLLLLCWLKNI